MEDSSFGAGQSGVWLACGGCSGGSGEGATAPCWHSRAHQLLRPARELVAFLGLWPCSSSPASSPASWSLSCSSHLRVFLRRDLFVWEGHAGSLAVVVCASSSKMLAPLLCSPSPEKQCCPCELRRSRLSCESSEHPWDPSGTLLSGPHSVLTQSCFSSLTPAALSHTLPACRPGTQTQNNV